MEISLKYRGPLLAATGANKQVAGKHAIRERIHEQLQVFWQTDPRFAGVNPVALQRGARVGGWFEVARPINGPAAWFYFHEVHGIQFVPLVTHVREAQCRLSIRLHRRQPPGAIVSLGGDLDNRQKTLFDALRMPHTDDELPAGVTAANTPSPFFCLLDDDALISKVTIETFRLLTPPAAGEDDNYVELEIEVEARPVTPMIGTIDWLFP